MLIFGPSAVCVRYYKTMKDDVLLAAETNLQYCLWFLGYFSSCLPASRSIGGLVWFFRELQLLSLNKKKSFCEELCGYVSDIFWLKIIQQ